MSDSSKSTGSQRRESKCLKVSHEPLWIQSLSEGEFQWNFRGQGVAWHITHKKESKLKALKKAQNTLNIASIQHYLWADDHVELKNSVHPETLSRKELWPALWVPGPVPLMVTFSPGLGKTLPKKPPSSQSRLRLFQNTITGWSPSFVLEGPFFLYVSSSARLSHQCVSFLGGKGMKTGGDPLFWALQTLLRPSRGALLRLFHSRPCSTPEPVPLWEKRQSRTLFSFSIFLSFLIGKVWAHVQPKRKRPAKQKRCYL